MFSLASLVESLQHSVKTSFPLAQDTAEKNLHGLFPRRLRVTFPHHMWCSSTTCHIFSPFPSPQYSPLGLSFWPLTLWYHSKKNQLLTGGRLQHAKLFPATKPFIWSGLTSTYSLPDPHSNLPTSYLSFLNSQKQNHPFLPVLRDTVIFKTQHLWKISMINPFLILSFLMFSRILLH